MQSIGRNDACPCGSGKKYKKCCLPSQQPNSDDLSWQRLHDMHARLMNKLIKFTAETYGAIGYNDAWDEFTLLQGDHPFDPSSPLHPMFGPWMFYHWTPNRLEPDLGVEIDIGMTPAEAFIEAFGAELSEAELEDLEENLRRPFSFYDVLESKPGSWVKVRDLITEERFNVIEKMGSKSMTAGDLICGKVMTIRDIAMFDAIAPIIFPPQGKVAVIHARKRFKGNDGQIRAARLREYDLEIREIFWDLYNDAVYPQMPILTNTDGHLVAPHKMIFAIDDLEDALSALHSLCFRESKEKLLERAARDKKGMLKSIEFPWLLKGNKKNKSWDNTVLGHILIEKAKMTVDVNSKERSERFLSILKERMPAGWALKATVVEDISSKPRGKKGLSPRGGELSDQAIKELNDRPEVKEHLAKMNEGHWQEWPMVPLPALKNKTPAEAIKTKDGKEMVDALITQFERHAERRPMPGQTVETFQRLRERLGL